jgi:hypothetical protein
MTTTNQQNATKARPARVAPKPSAPSHEAVAQRAYELFLQRGGGEGQDLEDWLRAESELRAAQQVKAPAKRQKLAS